MFRKFGIFTNFSKLSRIWKFSGVAEYLNVLKNSNSWESPKIKIQDH
jgi:hypothetical protein